MHHVGPIGKPHGTGTLIRQRRLVLGLAAACILVPAALFLANGVASRSAGPVSGVLGSGSEPADSAHLTIMAFNLAKCGFHRGGLSFRDTSEVRGTLDEIAALIRREHVDIAFLSEIVWEAGPCPVNQVTYLAEAAGLDHYAFGENYSFGLPWYRIRSGNAVISRVPIKATALQQLAGPQGLLDPTNCRRALWVEVDLGFRQFLAASVRNDSFNLENNAVQVAEILQHAAQREVVLAGDFNAEPDSASIRRLLDPSRFQCLPTGCPTYPARSPDRQIDYIVAPSEWVAVSQSVPETVLSDHRPVIATFAVR